MEKFLNEQLELIKPNSKELSELDKKTREIVGTLKKNIKKKKISADIFIGGSVAKGTLIKKKKYDVDIFVRFDKKYDVGKLSLMLKGVVPSGAKKVHGSRDYFSIKKDGTIFEIIPTIKIEKPGQAKNITDLSYFHVNYIKKQINKNKGLANEIRLGKAFAYYQDCYGAESYINGYSGYAVELLIAHYKTFAKFIKAMANAKSGLVIDSAKHYKSKEEVRKSLNKSKLHSPIILIDPTFEERNALAALSSATFEKFQKSCKAFIKKPSPSFFELKDKYMTLDKKYGNKLIKLQVKTNRQAGDIAGTKLKKFYNYFVKELSELFNIKKHDFDYDESKNVGTIFLVAEPKKQLIIWGPPIKLKKAVALFKKAHRKTQIKAGKIMFVQKLNTNVEKFLNNFKKSKKRIIFEMSISSLKI